MTQTPLTMPQSAIMAKNNSFDKKAFLTQRKTSKDFIKSLHCRIPKETAQIHRFTSLFKNCEGLCCLCSPQILASFLDDSDHSEHIWSARMKLSGPNPGYKVVVLGNSGTGKTSLLQCALSGAPRLGTQNTIGCECHQLNVTSGGEQVTLKLWDTAGQEVYRSIVPVYVRDAAAALLVYDLCDESSFNSLDHWYSLLMEEQQSESLLVYVVCNKIDLRDRACVRDSIARGFAEEKRAKFAEVSALTGDGVPDLFQNVADVLMQGRCGTDTNLVPIIDAGRGRKGCC
jgi:Ras-related protein Rab-21